MSTPRPKKSFGQHFLHEPQTLRRIAELATTKPGQPLVEIGPGTGNLTEALLATATAETLLAVERDPELARYLRENFDPERLRVVEADAARYAYAELIGSSERATVVGNLPYNAGTAIYFRLLTLREHISKLVLMFQREVAERIVAKPGSRAYGVPSVLTALSGRGRLALRVPPGAFHPPPKVDSAVVVVDLSVDCALALSGPEAEFVRFVKSAFAQRRKTVANALKSAGHVRADVESGLEAQELDVRARAESLSPLQLATLWGHLRGVAPPGSDC